MKSLIYVGLVCASLLANSAPPLREQTDEQLMKQIVDPTELSILYYILEYKYYLRGEGCRVEMNGTIHLHECAYWL